MNLDTASRIAEKIKVELAPLCDRIEIAGSIRRGRPEVNDIDLVILAQDQAAIKSRCIKTCQVVMDGDEIFTVRMRNGLQLDIFFARPEIADMWNPLPCNWGSMLMLRTGSKEHNIWLCQRAKKFGLEWKTNKGVVDAEGYILQSETEQKIYECLGLQFLRPCEREMDWIRQHLPDTQAKPASKPVVDTKPPRPESDPAAAAQATQEFRAWKASVFGENPNLTGGNRDNGEETPISVDSVPSCKIPV